MRKLWISWTLFIYLCSELKEQIKKQDTKLVCVIGFKDGWYTNSDHNCLDSEIYPSNPAEGSANDASDEPMYKECVKRSCYHTHYELYKRRDKLWSTPAQNHFGGKSLVDWLLCTANWLGWNGQSLGGLAMSYQICI